VVAGEGHVGDDRLVPCRVFCMVSDNVLNSNERDTGGGNADGGFTSRRAMKPRDGDDSRWWLVAGGTNSNALCMSTG
jgi:hypothetical protein